LTGLAKTRGPYCLGLPAWAFPGWKGRYFHDGSTLLHDYASVFNTVEGNTTFYRVPKKNTVAAWRDAIAGTDFRFCFKLPRTVTHERTPDLDDLRAFLVAMEPLGPRLGPFLLQFPARIGPAELPVIESLLDRMPEDFRCVIEVRHPRFFSEPKILEPLIARYRTGRVCLDSRPLYHGDRNHPDVVGALHEKPNLPVLPDVYNGLAFLRLVMHPAPAGNVACIAEWADRVAEFLQSGVETFVMIHCPNNLHCPPFALEFHRALMSRPGMEGLADLPPWPVPQQASLI
jgi:uncharacterized protein YecE (DUF72 family)